MAGGNLDDYGGSATMSNLDEASGLLDLAQALGMEDDALNDDVEDSCAHEASEKARELYDSPLRARIEYLLESGMDAARIREIVHDATERCDMKICQHCRAIRPATSQREGICKACFRVKNIRLLYYEQVDWRIIRSPTKFPEPTVTYPGTPARISVLEQRVAHGEQLWHPDDVTLFGTDDEMEVA
jgi:hypothetical protein